MQRVLLIFSFLLLFSSTKAYHLEKIPQFHGIEVDSTISTFLTLADEEHIEQPLYKPKNFDFLIKSPSWVLVKDKSNLKKIFFDLVKEMGFQGIVIDLDLSDKEYKKVAQEIHSANLLISKKLKSTFGMGGDAFVKALHEELPFHFLYYIVEIPETLKNIEIANDKLFAPINKKDFKKLKDAGLPIFGDAEHWGVTKEISTLNGKSNRFIFFYSKDISNPSFNFYHPSFLAQRCVCGEGYYDLNLLKADWLEFGNLESLPLPLDIMNIGILSAFVRQNNAISFQRLNAPYDELRYFVRVGSDLYFDFLSQTGIAHAALTKKCDLLALNFELLQKYGIPCQSLIHGLCFENGIDYSMAHFQKHENESFALGEQERVKGYLVKRNTVEEDIPILSGVLGERGAHFDILSTDLAAKALKIKDIHNLTAVDSVNLQNMELLLCAANALQPGLFLISENELFGKYDEGKLNLYDSKYFFKKQLKELLQIRFEQKIATAEFISLVDLQNKGACAVLFRHKTTSEIFLVAFNFTTSPVIENLSNKLFHNRYAFDIISNKKTKLADTDKFTLKMDALSYKIISFKGSFE